MPGQINSSTRSEAHGLLVGLCTKGPVHTGIDNKAVVDRACCLITLATNLCKERDDTEAMMRRIGLAFENARRLRKPETKHWQMQKDGDVWCAIWRSIISKGPKAIKVAKVKGHASNDDVTDGRVTAADKSGNDVADSLVREATLLHGKRTVDLAYWLEARHNTYKELMAQIQKFIIRMLTADKEERDRRKKEANPFEQIGIPKVTMPIQLEYSIEEGGRKLEIKDLPRGTHRFNDNSRALTYVHRLLRMITIRPTREGEPGVTWLELLIAFEMHGGRLETALQERQAADMARPVMTTRQLLGLFKSMVRFIMETCGDVLEMNFFRTSHTNGTRLRVLAIQHAMPSLNFMPIWNRSTAHLITQAILRQKGKMTRAMIKSHADGGLEVQWSSLSTKGVPAWRASVGQGPVLSLHSDTPYEVRNNSNSEHLIHDPELALVFACPKCACARSVKNCSLLVRSGWGHILCKICHITTRSMTWRCACGLQWHSCPVHSRAIRPEDNE